MSRSVVSLALRIAQILEESSSLELREAVSLLEKHGYRHRLLEYLAAAGANKASRDPVSRLERAKPLDEITSRAVRDLEEKDPEKYRLLSEFDKLVRKGVFLRSNDALRRFGETLSKAYEPRKSRRENIGVIMTLLSEKRLDEIAKLLEFGSSIDSDNAADRYQNLAHFLIRGKPSE
jgi:hypothetical protein